MAADNNTLTFNLDFNSPDIDAHFSSSLLAGLVCDALTLYDFNDTFALNYPRQASAIQRAHGSDTASQGTSIDFTAEHNEVALGLTILNGVLAIGNVVTSYRANKRGLERASYKTIYQAIQSQPSSQNKIAECNVSLEKALMKNHSLQKQYESIRVEEVKDENQVVTGWKVTVKKNSICPDITLLSLPEDEDQLSKALANARKSYRPVLIKRAGKYFVYGDKEGDGKWDYTEIVNENDNLASLPFAEKIVQRNNPLLTPALINQLKVGHSGLVPPKAGMPKPVKKAIKIADETSNSLGLISFTYWIFYITAASFTGVFDVGVSGVTPLLGFGLPLLVGLAYAGWKLRNWYKNRKKNLKVRGEFNALTEEAALDKEFENAKTQGKSNSVSLDAKLENQPQLSVVPSKTQAVAGPGFSRSSMVNAGIMAMVGTYVGWQYNMWYVTDVLSSVFHVAVEGASQAIGIGIFVVGALAGIRAIRNAYNAYQQNKLENNATGFIQYLLNDLKPDMKTNLLKQQQDRVAALEKEVDGLAGDLDTKKICPVLDARLNQYKKFDEESKNKSWYQKARNFFHVANFGMTGVFIVRTILVRGTTSFLLPGLGAALCLSNPWTIGIMVAAGIVWGLYKYYHYRKAKNLAKIEHANQRIKLLEKKREILQARQQELKSKNDMKPENDSERNANVSNHRESVVSQASAPEVIHAPELPKTPVVVVPTEIVVETKNQVVVSTPSTVEAPVVPVDVVQNVPSVNTVEKQQVKTFMRFAKKVAETIKETDQLAKANDVTFETAALAAQVAQQNNSTTQEVLDTVRKQVRVSQQSMFRTPCASEVAAEKDMSSSNQKLIEVGGM